MRRSKIVATIGPASENISTISELIKNGVNLFRFNFKYNTPEWHRQRIEMIRKISKKEKTATGIIADIPRSDFLLGIEDFDYIALSYLKIAEEITDLKKRYLKKGKEIKVIAKIENSKAIKNLDDITNVCDGVMVARGDLGNEVPIKELAYLQKHIIDTARKNNKPVIVATQMLLSMTENENPTRAETTDVANAVFDGTDALMLSEETAIGKYPVEAVKTMAEIADYCENTGELRHVNLEANKITEKLIEAAANITMTSQEIPIKNIIVFTKSGNTARMLSKYRLGTPIIAISDDKFVLNALCLSFGVIPYYKNFVTKEFKSNDSIFDEIKKLGLIKNGQTIITIYGTNWMESGSTNHLSLKTI